MAGSFFQPGVACFVSLSPGVGTGLFHWLEQKRRVGEVTRSPDLLALAVLTSGTGCISFSCEQDAAFAPRGGCVLGPSAPTL